MTMLGAPEPMEREKAQRPMNWIFLFSAGFLFLVAVLLLGLERGDKVGEVVFHVIGSTPIRR